MKSIKLGIIGMGRMGITHYSIINSHPNVEIIAVVDTSSFILNLIKKYIKQINTYSDYNSLFEKEQLDAVIICTPPTLHYQIAKRAAEKGVHVFSEKPFTLNKKHAKELTILFEQKKLVNQVGYVNRFNDIFQTVKQYLKNNIIGDVISFKSEMYSCTITKDGNDKTWRGTHDKGGGVIYEMAAHAIDLVNFLIGKPDKITGSCLTSVFSTNVEDVVSTAFIYKNGVSGTLNVNWSDKSYRKPTNKIEIFGSKGKILADQHGIKIFLISESTTEGFHAGWNSVYITDVFKPVPFYVRGNEFTAEIYHFIDCIVDNELKNNCTFRNATDTLEVIDAIFNDYELNGTI